MSERAKSWISSFVQIFLFLAILYAIRQYDAMLFYSLVEIITVAVSVSIFIITWNARRFIDNSYFLFVGISFLFVGILDLIHVFTYESANSMAGARLDVSTQFWLAARFLTAASFFLATFFAGRKLWPKTSLAFNLFFFAAISAAIAYFNFFPSAIPSAIDFSLFKKTAEYFIAAVFISSGGLLVAKRRFFNPDVFKILVAALCLSAVMEILFANYRDVSADSGNALLYVKFIAYYLIYVSFVEMVLRKPYKILFKNLKDGEKALRASEELYRSLVEFSPDAIVVHANDKIIYVNTVACDLFGAKESDELIGHHLMEFIHYQFRDFVEARIKELYNGSTEAPLREIKIITLQNKTVEVESKGRLIDYQNHNAILSIIRPITNRKIAVEDASDHVVIADPEGRIVYANKAAEKMTGYTREEMIGHTPSLWGNLINQKNVSSYRRAWDKISKDNPFFSGEVVNQRKNGQKYIADLHISPVYDDDNEIIFYIAMEQDITRLKEIDQAKTEFVSLASHQLRTPLSSILLTSELLLRGVSGGVDETQKAYLKEINTSSKKMAELIDALLNISRIELGTFIIKPETINIIEAVGEITAELKNQTKNKAITIEQKYADDLPTIKFDKNILEMTVENLLTNAIKYSPKGSKIKIEAEKRILDVLIQVADRGCGIRKEDQHKIFTKLFRAENAKIISPDGAGLGLYIVKSLLNKVSAKIWFDSEPNIGTTFYISIPLKDT